MAEKRRDMEAPNGRIDRVRPFEAGLSGRIPGVERRRRDGNGGGADDLRLTGEARPRGDLAPVPERPLFRLRSRGK
jgi:hypothetical protein